MVVSSFIEMAFSSKNLVLNFFILSCGIGFKILGGFLWVLEGDVQIVCFVGCVVLLVNGQSSSCRHDLWWRYIKHYWVG